MNGLKQERQAKGMSQRELAEKCGVTQAVISILETCEIEPRDGLLSAINKALGKKFDDEQKGGRMTQKQRVLDYMRKHGSISQQEAISAFSCYRLAAQIFKLRKEGIVIKTKNIPFRNEYTNGYYAVYFLVEEQ